MKKITNIFMLIFVLVGLFGTASCESSQKENTPTNAPESETPGHKHSFSSNVVEPSVGVSGYTSYTCDECGYVYHDSFKDALTDTAHSHVFTAEVVAPTKEHNGYTIYRCSGCAYIYYDSIKDALLDTTTPEHEHEFESKVIEAAVGQVGYTKYECECGYVYCDSFVAELPDTSIPEHEHEFESEVIEATVGKVGYTKYECECGYVYCDSFVAALPDTPKHEHEFESEVIEATTGKVGYTSYTCDECGYVYCDSFVAALPETPKHEHEYIVSIIPSTCENQGYTSHYCLGYEYRDTFEAALEHDFNTLISSDLNLESEVGEEMYKCDTCKKIISTTISSINTPTKGVTDFALGENNKFKISANEGYSADSFTLTVSNVGVEFSGSLYYTFNADYGLFYNKAFRLDFNSNGTATTSAYDSGKYKIESNNLTHFEYDAETNKINFTFNYSEYGLTKELADGNFAFYLIVTSREKTYEYKDRNPYVLPGYSQTWIKVNTENRFYYTTKYQELHEQRLRGEWSRPDITKADINWTHICRAETPEEAVVSTMIAEEQGATNVDVNLVYLKPIYRNYDDMYRIYHAFKDIGTISVYYNSDVSQQERMDLLKLSVEAGAGGIDMQGFMFHEGSTKDTHTAENIKYWEDLGYDMSFINASPKEMTIDPEEDKKIIAYIDEIHALGGKVLGSSHVGTEFTRAQIYAYAKFLDHRGLDIIKVVSHAYNTAALEGTILANRDVYYSNEINAKFSIHCNSSSQADISRIVGPLYYHCYMAFNYNYLCKLQMMMDFLHSGVDLSDTTSVKDAIENLRGHTEDPEYEYLYNEYKQLTSNVAYALGANSNMSDRWSFNGEDTYLKLRSVEGTNSFSIRGAAYIADNYSNDFEYETKITGFFKPYTSSVRLPKFGIFIGNQDKMLALTYNFETKNGVGTKYSIGVYTNSYYFGFDTKTKDALDTSLIEPVLIDSNIVENGNIRLKVKYENGNLSLYYSIEKTGEMILIKTFTYDEIKDYFIHDADKSVYFGNVVEVYLGSTSVGYLNEVKFSNTVTK